MRYLFFSMLLLFGMNSTAKPANEADEVMKAVFTLFDGMREADSAKVHSVFTDDAKMYTVMEVEGEMVLREGSLQRFLDAVGTPHDIVWDEPIWNYSVNIDGHLASVWTQYAFFAGEKFSHCGVDAFKLFKTSEGWKIYSLSDTRQKEGCELPEADKLLRGL